MKAIMVMYDSLNRNYLPNYGGELAKMPNFKRLQEHSVVFDNAYVGSLPCMPARRELHTGRLNFLHRSWCPIEPFDDSMPEILKNNGVYTHLISDHQHYWEDGGATYHTRYQSWECIRGQEGDPWKGSLEPVVSQSSFGTSFMEKQNKVIANMHRQDWLNRSYFQEEKDFPQAQTFSGGLDFIEKNKDYNNWFLQIETFDPHEPFFSPKEYQYLYWDKGEEIPAYDWPPYGPVEESDEVVANVRKKYYALLSMCDTYLGKVLDLMDRYDMWKDTMLIVNTDHGYMLGEHLWWAKGLMPLYNEMANIPLFIWDPRCKKQGERRKALVQTIDLAPTLLEFFGIDISKDMQGKVLKNTIAADDKVRDYALYGFFGSMINITDGVYTYMRAPYRKENKKLIEYTLMPTAMRARLSPAKLKDMTLHEPFSFTKECPVMAIPTIEEWGMLAPCYRYGDKLYDLRNDPKQEIPVDDIEKELEMIWAMRELMLENDAPAEQFERMGIPYDRQLKKEELLLQRKRKTIYSPVENLMNFTWDKEAEWQFTALINLALPFYKVEDIYSLFEKYMKDYKAEVVNKERILNFMRSIIPETSSEAAEYTLKMISRLE